MKPMAILCIAVPDLNWLKLFNLKMDYEEGEGAVPKLQIVAKGRLHI